MSKIFILIIAILIIAGGIFWWQKDNVSNLFFGESPKACTQEAKLCPDGSYVGRTGPNCEFAACPGETSVDTSTWKTYRNEKYGFEVRYPPEMSIGEFSNQDLFVLNLRSDRLFGGLFIMSSLANGEPEKHEGEDVTIGGVSTTLVVSEEHTESTSEIYRVIQAAFNKDTQSFLFILKYKKDGSDQSVLIKTILSTFKFIEPKPSGQTLVCSWHNDCLQNAVCYNSQPAFPTSQGVEFGPEEGDKLCHRQCVTNSDCSSYGEGTCIEKEIFIGDVGGQEKFCSEPLSSL